MTSACLISEIVQSNFAYNLVLGVNTKICKAELLFIGYMLPKSHLPAEIVHRMKIVYMTQNTHTTTRNS
jgi:hypothetical protein